MFIGKIIEQKKAQDIVILDMRKISNISDFFIICNGNSARQVKAIADFAIEELKQNGDKVWHIEGYRFALWILLDCGEVVVHIFTPLLRRFYNLERLWAEAPAIVTENDHAE